MALLSWVTVLLGALSLSSSGCSGSSARRAVGSSTIDEYVFHVRKAQGAKTYSTWSHLQRASSLSRSFQMYAETGSSEDGIGVAFSTLFTEFLGPYSFEELGEAFDHLQGH